MQNAPLFPQRPLPGEDSAGPLSPQGPLKIAVIGWNEVLLAFIDYLSRSGGGLVVSAYDCGEEGWQVIQQAFPLVSQGTADALWPAGQDVDAVVVGPGAVDRQAELSALLRYEMPVLITSDALSDVLAFYELDIARQDLQALLLCEFFERYQPQVDAFTRLLQERKFAKETVGSVVFERVAMHGAKPIVLRRLMEDLDLIRASIGEIAKIHVMGSWNAESAPPSSSTRGDRDVLLDGSQEFAALDVQLQGVEAWQGRWSLRLCHDEENQPSSSLLAVQGRKRLQLYMPEESPWNIEGAEGAEHSLTTHTSQAWSTSRALLSALQSGAAGNPAPVNWPHAIRAAELREAVLKSLAKGKTIDVKRDEGAEASNFKAIMASVGCLMLLALPVFLIMGQIAENALAQMGLAWAAPLFRALPALAAIALGLFLASQFLLRTIPKQQP